MCAHATVGICRRWVRTGSQGQSGSFSAWWSQPSPALWCCPAGAQGHPSSTRTPPHLTPLGEVWGWRSSLPWSEKGVEPACATPPGSIGWPHYSSLWALRPARPWSWPSSTWSGCGPVVDSSEPGTIPQTACPAQSSNTSAHWWVHPWPCEIWGVTKCHPLSTKAWEHESETNMTWTPMTCSLMRSSLKNMFLDTAQGQDRESPSKPVRRVMTRKAVSGSSTRASQWAFFAHSKNRFKNRRDVFLRHGSCAGLKYATAASGGQNRACFNMGCMVMTPLFHSEYTIQTGGCSLMTYACLSASSFHAPSSSILLPGPSLWCTCTLDMMEAVHTHFIVRSGDMCPLQTSEPRILLRTSMIRKESLHRKTVAHTGSPLIAFLMTSLISHHSPHTPHLTSLISNHSSHTTHLTAAHRTTTHLTPLISHHSSHTTHLTPLISHHPSHHHSSRITHHTPLITHHSSHTIHLTPLISHHSYIRPLISHHSSHTTHLTPLISHHSHQTTHLTPRIAPPLASLVTHHSPHTIHLKLLISHPSYHITHIKTPISHHSSHCRSSHHHSSHITHLTPLISHHSSHTIHLTPLISHHSYIKPLISHRSSHTTHCTTTHLASLIAHHSSHITHLTPLISHHSTHTTHIIPFIAPPLIAHQTHIKWKDRKLYMWGYPVLLFNF